MNQRIEQTRGAPRWLILTTIIFTLLILLMAVAETNLWMHFLVDRGENVSIAGAVFISAVGICLYRQGRLKASLQLFIPWLLYPVLTQGDQLIDNLTINQMRLVCHAILGIIFAAPAIVLILALQHFAPAASPQQTRKRQWLIALAMLIVEMWIAFLFLGVYMIATLILMSVLFALYMISTRGASERVRFTERGALILMSAGVVISIGLFLGFKNRPGAYQGSPAAFMDAAQRDAIYDVRRIAVASGPVDEMSPVLSAEIQAVCAGYGEVLKGLVHAYWLMDRNYNYWFHNELFWRATPIVENFRSTALDEISRLRRLVEVTDKRAADLLQQLRPGSATAALIQEEQSFVAYNLRRAALLEQMSAGFEKTKAGLQHATHLYEGEGKMVDVLFSRIVDKHKAALSASTLVAADPFVQSSRQVHQTYSNRIVGF